MKRPKQGRALFYHRDSGGRHEQTPSQYVAWAQRRAAELRLSFAGSPELIDSMIRDGKSVSADIFLDYGVTGNLLSRPGLDALIHEARRDRGVTHILIPRRDRFARPDDALDGVKLESDLRKDGLTLVFMDRVCAPLARGQRADIAETICTVIDYDHAGRDRRDLAQKIVYAQIRLAKRDTRRAGGRPSGFAAGW